MKKKIDLSGYDEKELWTIRNLLRESAIVHKNNGDQENYKETCGFIVAFDLEIEKRVLIRKRFISAQAISKSLYTFVKKKQ